MANTISYWLAALVPVGNNATQPTTVDGEVSSKCEFRRCDRLSRLCRRIKCPRPFRSFFWPPRSFWSLCSTHLSERQQYMSHNVACARIKRLSNIDTYGPSRRDCCRICCLFYGWSRTPLRSDPGILASCRSTSDPPGESSSIWQEWSTAHTLTPPHSPALWPRVPAPGGSGSPEQ